LSQHTAPLIGLEASHGVVCCDSGKKS